MKKTEESHLNIKAASHPGMTGKQNEDRYGVVTFNVEHEQQTPSVLAVLCDGIGGHRAGEVAAEMGVSMITEFIAASNGDQPLRIFQEAITRANHAIYAASQTDQGRKGMGATCACAWVIGDLLYTTNLGDSRIYLLREGHLIQLTTDHTWIQEAMDAGIISDAEGNDHPNAHVIRRYLGSQKAPKPDFRLWYFEDEQDSDAVNNQGMQVKTGDILLLCSDGLTDLLADEEICAVITDTPFAEVPDSLINIANTRGGHDNTTIVLMEVPSQRRGQLRSNRRRRWLIRILAYILLVSLIVMVSVLGFCWWHEKLDAVEPIEPVVRLTLPTSVPTLTVTDTPTPSATLTSPAVEETPMPSITPWPTNTQSP